MFIRNTWIISGLEQTLRGESIGSRFFTFSFLLTTGREPAWYRIASAVNIASDKLLPTHPSSSFLTEQDATLSVFWIQRFTAERQHGSKDGYVFFAVPYEFSREKFQIMDKEDEIAILFEQK